MSPSIKQQISTAFAGVGHPSLSPDLLAHVTALSTSFKLSPTQLAEAWEAHSLTKDVDTLDTVTLKGYQSALAKEHGNNNNNKVVMTGTTGLGKRKPGVTPSPAVNKRLATSTPSAAATTPGMDKGNNNNNYYSSRNGLSAVDNLTTPSGSGKGGAVSPSSSKQKIGVAAPGSAAAAAMVITPPKSSTTVSFKQTPKYSERTNAGQLVQTYNPHNLPTALEVAASKSSEEKARVGSHVGVTITQHSTGVENGRRHMFAPLEKRSAALETRLTSMNNAICAKYGIKSEEDEMIEAMEGVVKTEHPVGNGGDVEVKGEETMEGSSDNGVLGTWVPVGLPKQNKVLCVGRICNEAHEGKLNRASIRLEGSRQHSAGSRIHVDLNNLADNTNESFSFFPGQIVAIEGIDSSGRTMQASRLLEGVTPPKETLAPSDLLDYQYGDKSQNGNPLSIVTLCGPYTTKDNLDYDPFLDAISKISESKPDVVIMCGPFVDGRHPQIAGGEPTVKDESGEERKVSYEYLFANNISQLLEEVYANDPECKTQFVLVPSLDDAFLDNVYPQPPIQSRVAKFKVPKGLEGEFGDLGLQYVESAGRENVNAKERSKRVHCVSNPCTLQINDVTIGVTSTDVLYHIAMDECNANLPSGTRLSRIAQHLIQQRSYYPLFPAAKGASLDLTKSTQWEMEVQPDILIVPSKLTSFARKVLDSTVVVNPGALTKNATGGTYAVMDVHPMKKEVLVEGMQKESSAGEETRMEKGVQDRVRVDIRRI